MLVAAVYVGNTSTFAVDAAWYAGRSTHACPPRTLSTCTAWNEFILIRVHNKQPGWHEAVIVIAVAELRHIQ